MTSTPATQRTAVCCTTVALLVVLFGVVGAINVVLAITSAVWWPWLVAAACTTAMIATLAATRAHGHSAPPQDPHRRLFVRVAGSVVPSVRVESPTAVYRGTLNPVGTGAVDVTYTVVNDGNLRLALRPSITVSALFGLSDRTTTGDVLPELLPGNAVTLTHTVTGVWPLGPLEVHARAEPVTSATQDLAGTVEPASADTSLWAVSWTMLAAVALLVGVLVALWRVRRRIRLLRASTKPVEPAASTPAP